MSEQSKPWSRLLLARRVAAMLGVKTGTLAKWRRLGKGPKGAVALSPTTVAYPEDEVAAFLEACASQRPAFPEPPKRTRPGSDSILS